MAEPSQPPEPVDFFISYATVDRSWALWISQQLQSAGYSTRLDVENFTPGTSFLQAMEMMIAQSRQTVALLSPDYLKANYNYTRIELESAMMNDPKGLTSALVPVRVRETELPNWISRLIYIDLVGLDEAAARERLLAGVKGPIAEVSSGFPGKSPTTEVENSRLIGAAELDLSQMNLAELPESLGLLRQLQTLNLSDNQLVLLPESLLRLTTLRELYLHDNDALGMPPEVLEPKCSESAILVDAGSMSGNTKRATLVSPADILGYYFRVRRGRRALNEAKLILVGRGGVGKTCLIKRLIYGTFDEHEPETPGIEIQPWQVTLEDGDQVRLHVWDFGGQEILHATHQFF